MQRSEETLKALKKQSPSPQLKIDIARLEKELELCKQEKRCHEAQILTVCPNFVCVCVCVFAHTYVFMCILWGPTFFVLGRF